MENLKFKLNDKHPLFRELMVNPPIWWENVKSHPELYIEIRKDNYINIYYQGGSIARVSYKAASEKIVAEAHPKYLGKNDDTEAYSDCTDWLANNLDELLLNVEAFYSNKNSKDIDPENKSEKKIQGEIITAGREQFIDSEFQHLISRRQINSGLYENKFIRIDLIKVVNNTLVFVELKHIKDNRLLDKDIASEPEIISQMKSYGEFLEANKSAIIEYYKILYRIKANLNLPLPIVDNINLLTANSKPELLIKNVYVRQTKDRCNRISNIEAVLNRNDINYTIEK